MLNKLVRGRPQLRALREIMDEVYRLFDRRCKTATALQRLTKAAPARAAVQEAGHERWAS